jgi:hypothetical protein
VQLLFLLLLFIATIKVKVVPLRSIEAHLGDRRYSSYSFLTSALEGGEWSASHAPAALHPRGKSPRYPLYRRLGGPQSRSGCRGYNYNKITTTINRRTTAIGIRLRISVGKTRIKIG